MEIGRIWLFQYSISQSYNWLNILFYFILFYFYSFYIFFIFLFHFILPILFHFISACPTPTKVSWQLTKITGSYATCTWFYFRFWLEFNIWAGIRVIILFNYIIIWLFNSSPSRKQNYLIPAQTGNRIMNMWDYFLSSVSVFNWPLWR